MAVKRVFYQDKWNKNKIWEVAHLVHGYYLRQYVCGIQFGNGIRTSKRFIKSLGIFEFEEVAGI